MSPRPFNPSASVRQAVEARAVELEERQRLLEAVHAVIQVTQLEQRLAELHRVGRQQRVGGLEIRCLQEQAAHLRREEHDRSDQQPERAPLQKSPLASRLERPKQPEREPGDDRSEDA
mgnify:CR=1 FL=1